MLKHPTLDKLQALKLTGMAAALADQSATPDITDLNFEERLGLIVDREMTEQDNRRMISRLRRARLRHNAVLENLVYRHSRGLDKGLVQSLAGCQWVKEHLKVLITGPTGVGKTLLACALAHKACRERAVRSSHPTTSGADHCQGRWPILKTPDESGQGRRADPG